MGRNQSGSKSQRQNQYVRRLTSKIKKFKSAGKDTSGMEKELGYMMGEQRPSFPTGSDADSRKKRYGE